MSDYTTRPVEAGDAEAIRSIYNVEVLESTVTFDMVERSLEDQIAWITDHSGSYPAIVAVDPSTSVVGFASLTAYRPRPAYATTVENSVYVHRDHRGAGVARLLMESLLTAAADHGFHSVIARIVGGHTASIALHKRTGFTEIGREVEVGRKFGKWLDVVLMQKML
jgi:L-amino acid N-acyltransferase